MKILVFDNYDSFTYNLVHLAEKISNKHIEVCKNDAISLDEINAFDKIILSPGPGLPREAGSLLDVINEYAPSKSILGVCLGHQAIAESFGGKLLNLSSVFHGVSSNINAVSENSVISPLFHGLPDTFEVGRYHSWIVSEEDFPATLEVTARDENNYIMGLQHKNYDVMGVQFHPESILTPFGERILENWINS